jgi:glyoxylase-like metal-dependent hydrolase (beta-lactamase superfamily II)
MPDDILELADRLWRGEVTSSEFHPVAHHRGLAEVRDGVAFLPSFANVSAFETEDGLVLVDTGSSFVAAAVHEELRRWSGQRLNTAVYSHGHIDHTSGVPVWEAESAERGWPAPVVVAHEALPRRFDRYLLTTGYNEVINQRQFGARGLRWPTEYRYPDRTYRDELRLDVGGAAFRLRHEKGETDDHTVTWLAGRKVLCCGDLFIWASPNAGNPQKVQRYPREWAEALRRMAGLGAEYLLPGHGLPVVGADRIRQALGETAELLEALVDQTLEVMNRGGRLDDAIHSVRPPAGLEARPYLRPVYDEPEFIVRNIWRLYGGWWDGNPATLKPAPERALAAELAGPATARPATRRSDWPVTLPSLPGWPPRTITRSPRSAAGCSRPEPTRRPPRWPGASSAGPRTRVLSTGARDTRCAQGSRRDRGRGGHCPARSSRTHRQRRFGAWSSALPRC